MTGMVAVKIAAALALLVAVALWGLGTVVASILGVVLVGHLAWLWWHMSGF